MKVLLVNGSPHENPSSLCLNYVTKLKRRGIRK